MTRLTDNAGAPAIILFGSPGSGKGTQAKLLKNTLRVPHISTGDMLRSHIEAGDQIGLESNRLIKSGRLVPDEMVNLLVRERLGEPDCQNGIILDGYPRTINQAKVLLEYVRTFGFAPGVVHLEVDNEKIVARLTGRRQCPVCGTLYSLTTNPPKVAGICDLDGNRLVTREDDRESVIRERLSQYEVETRPLLEFFEQVPVPTFAIQAGELGPEAISQQVIGSLRSADLIR